METGGHDGGQLGWLRQNVECNGDVSWKPRKKLRQKYISEK